MEHEQQFNNMFKLTIKSVEQFISWLCLRNVVWRNFDMNRVRSMAGQAITLTPSYPSSKAYKKGDENV